MSILKWTAIGELAVAITSEEGAEVEIALAGFESEYHLAISTKEEAVKQLRAAADWIEKMIGESE
jgi:L-arabinose isomerase